jgi:hypothetical protein
MLVNYGSDGVRLLLASALDIPLGGVLGILGFILMVILSDLGTPILAGQCVDYAAIFSAVLGVIRILQGVRAGRRHRAGRPFSQPGTPLPDDVWAGDR